MCLWGFGMILTPYHCYVDWWFTLIHYFLICLLPAEGGPWSQGNVIRTTTNEQISKQSSPTPSISTTTGLVYDERMMDHLNMWDKWVTCKCEKLSLWCQKVMIWYVELCPCRHHPEQPQRIFKIFSKHQQLGLVERCQRIPARLATEEELSRCHRSVIHFWNVVIY